MTADTPQAPSPEAGWLTMTDAEAYVLQRCRHDAAVRAFAEAREAHAELARERTARQQDREAFEARLRSSRVFDLETALIDAESALHTYRQDAAALRSKLEAAERVRDEFDANADYWAERAAEALAVAEEAVGSLTCDGMYHRKADRHGVGDPCPAIARLAARLAKLQEAR